VGQILLEDGEIKVTSPTGPWYIGCAQCAQRVAKAQLKKVRSKISVVEIPQGKSAGYNVDGKTYIALAMLVEDWEALQKEVDS